ncbi:MAG: hypothetical protein HN849_16660 [Victivallales bacterium]|nr:hypothetical protein [Victivallales bacterium]
MKRLLFCLVWTFLAMHSGQAAELRLIDSAMYGRLAILTEGPVQLDVALTEGARIVSWQIDGQEIGFVGRFWGGDLYDRYKVGETGGDTRFRSPAGVEILRQDGLVAVRASFDIRAGVTLRRTFALSPSGFFLEAEFDGADGGWYDFAPHLIRSRKEPFPELRFVADGKQVRRPLKPKEKYKGLPSRLAVTGLAEPALAISLGTGMGLSPRAWSTSMSLDMGGTHRGQPLRASCWLTPEEGCEQAVESPPEFPSLDGNWQAAPHRVPEPKRPPIPEIAQEYGPYGTCNSRSAYMAPLAASGLRWVRVGAFSWANCEAEPGTRDYAAAEAALAATAREGLAIIGEMSGNPGWATVNGSRLAPPKDWQAWERHVEQVVTRFRDRVHVWEIWNEPDIGQFWTGTPEEYVLLLKHAYIGAKRADPDCLVMSAGLDGGGEKYLARLLELGAGEYCDLVGGPPYAGSAEVADFRMAIMRRILAFHKLNKPLWITEIGWQSGGWKSGPGVVGSEEIKAERLAAAYPLLSKSSDVVCWYVGVEPGKMYGLIQPTGKAGFILNPAWHAMRKLALPDPAGIRIETPPSATVQAGKATTLKAIVRNDRPVQARWLGIEPSWGTSDPIRIPANQATEVPLSLATPAYIKAETRHLLLVVQDLEGRHLSNQTVDLTVENPGRVCAFTIGGGWIRLIGRDGKDTGSWKPAHNLGCEPGQGFVQPVRPRNLGNFTDTLKLEIGGTAAKWLDSTPSTTTVAVGKTGWESLRVRVPANASPGTYTLTVRAQSQTFPEVKAGWRGSYSVVAPKEQ